MTKAVLLSIALCACATGDPTMQVGYGGGGGNKPRQAPTFPTRISKAEIPSARTIAPRLLLESEMTAGLNICVDPKGSTAMVSLRESSGDKRFDDAVVADARSWTYEPTGETSCEKATINYVP
jgi:TonB family protein